MTVRKGSDRSDAGVSVEISPLPRGRHGIPAEEVERNQRERVALAVVRVLAEHGYAGITVESLGRAARISRSTFYAHFACKEEAVLAAYDLIFARFSAAVAAVAERESDQRSRVRAAIAITLDFASAEPAQAQLLSGLTVCADPQLSRHVFDSHDRLALLLCDSGGGGDLAPGVAARALVGALAVFLARRQPAGDPGSVRELKSKLMALVGDARDDPGSTG